MQIRVQETPDDFGRCGCGRSPSGKCIGWHNLTMEQYQAALIKYESQLSSEIDGNNILHTSLASPKLL